MLVAATIKPDWAGGLLGEGGSSAVAPMVRCASTRSLSSGMSVNTASSLAASFMTPNRKCVPCTAIYTT